MEKPLHGRKEKIKVGTILDAGVYQRLKEKAAREGRSIGGLIEEAVLRLEREDDFGRGQRLRAVERLFAMRFVLPDEDWKIIMEDDFYEQ